MRPAPAIVRAPRAAWVAYAASVVVGLLVLLTFSFGRDQGIYGIVAERWRHGAWPYEGAWDFKPPGIFLVFVVVQAAFGTTEAALRGAEVASTIALLVALHVYVVRVLRSEVVAIVAGSLALLTHLFLDFWHTAQPETFAAPLLVAALILSDLEGALATVLLGVLGGLLFLIKPPLGAAAAMPLAARFARGRAPFSRVAIAFAASLAPIAALVFAFHRAGALGALRETLFVFAPGYTKLGWAKETASTLTYQAMERALFWFSGPLALGLGLRIASRRPWAPLGDLLLALAMCLVGTALQAKLFPYHFGSILPLEAVIAAEGFVVAWSRASVRGRSAIAAAATFAFVGRGVVRDVPGTFLERVAQRLRAYPAFVAGDRSTFERLDRAADLDNAENRELARWFTATARPHEAAFLFGFEPAVYLFAHRDPATRYVYDVPLRASGSGPHRARLLEDLARTKPAAIALERDDRMQWVTGSDQDSLEAAHAFPEFMAFLEAGYVKIDDLGRFERWVRRAPDAAASPPPDAPAASP